MDLLERIRRRDESALEEAVALWQPFLAALARKLTDDHGLASEAVNDVFLRLWRSPPPGSDVPLRTWLSAVLQRRLIDLWRGKSKQRQREAVARGPAMILVTVRPIDELVDRLDDEWRMAVLHEMIRALPPQVQPVVKLSLQELPMGAIAQRLGIPEGTVKSRLHSGRKTLERLAQQMKAG